MANQPPTGVDKPAQASGALDAALVDEPPDFQIDWIFIRGVESTELVGYVPLAKKSQSGVSIATGFDIGQNNKRDLVRLGLPDELVKKLSPYCLLKREVAADFLRKHPLTITRVQAAIIDSAVRNYISEKLEREYDAESTVPFQSLPAEVQTVIMSVEFQYGTISAKKVKLWQTMTKQLWKETIVLLHGKSIYRTRRDKEAALLQKVVDREREQS